MIELRIIIIGGGRTGFTLAERLSLGKHDVTIIDTNEDVLQSVAERLDAMYIRGSGASLSILRQANVEHADLVIAVTRSDEVNMLCCISSKKLGAKHTVARIHDPEYARDAELFKRQLDIDFVINPERSTAGEILRLLRLPAAVEIDTFYRGRVEFIGFRVAREDEIAGVSLTTLRKKMKIPVLVCVVEREGALQIPSGDFVITEGDLIYIVGKYTDITKFFRAIGRLNNIADNSMILGGGRTTHYLALLAADIGIKSVIIESDEKRCAKLAEAIPHATVIHGDGTDQELLELENIRGMDAFVALTSSDEQNLMLSLFANQCGIRKIVAKADNPNYIPLVSSLGVECIVSPNEITANHILHFVRGICGSRGSEVLSMREMHNGEIEALEFVVGNDARYRGVKIRDLPIKRGVIIAVLSRNGKSIIPDGDDVLKEGDGIVIVSEHTGFDKLNDIFIKG